MTTATTSTTSISSDPVSFVSETADTRNDLTAAVDAPSQSRYVITAVIVSTVIFFVGVGGGVLWANGEFAGAFGVGLFTAFWGGPGFGVMAGLALYNLALERLDASSH